ncbi:uncharacterized protein LOC119980993 [Tripterygium wilfordii]|uniref:uncharacterized protein LOC119980993 n=1 Tax=Tripterygium wilfordii TaxID=458696 RepID=UPI0018F812DB|nr:uncharacterized protein LOC119980993 [Tripterygium wilfordii]
MLETSVWTIILRSLPGHGMALSVRGYTCCASGQVDDIFLCQNQISQIISCITPSRREGNVIIGFDVLPNLRLSKTRVFDNIARIDSELVSTAVGHVLLCSMD